MRYMIHMIWYWQVARRYQSFLCSSLHTHPHPHPHPPHPHTTPTSPTHLTPTPHPPSPPHTTPTPHHHTHLTTPTLTQHHPYLTPFPSTNVWKGGFSFILSICRESHLWPRLLCSAVTTTCTAPSKVTSRSLITWRAWKLKRKLTRSVGSDTVAPPSSFSPLMVTLQCGCA